MGKMTFGFFFIKSEYFKSDLCAGYALIDMLVKSSAMDVAYNMFEKMRKKITVTHLVMLHPTGPRGWPKPTPYG
jgi:hypothetical protein